MDYEKELKEYYSCNIIEHGFDAQINSINLCCREGTGSFSRKIVILPNFSGAKIDWESFFQKKDLLRDIQKEGSTIPQCIGCVYLEKKIWDNNHYISSININNWIKCNANCIYCDRKEYKNKKEYKIYPIIKDLINKKYLRNPVDITIAGGEPTISSDFDKTLNILIKNNFSTIRVLTNAIKYNKYIEKGLENNLVNILVSIDAGSREVYKKIKLTDKYSIVWKNINKYVEKQAQKSLVKTKYIIIPEINNYKEELKLFIEQNYKAGVGYVYIDLEIGFYIKNSQNYDLLKEIYDLYLFAKEYGETIGITIEAFDRIKIIENKLKK